MSKRQYKARPTEPVLPLGANALPTNLPIAVYYRQSTDAQVGNVSTAIQTVDMVAYLKQRGWSEGQILMIDMDAGISGTKKIDERPGMRMLFDMVTNRSIGAVACQDEDRLFRDVTQIQVNIFIEACRASHVLVITPSMVYDFANEQMGTFHARQFRFKSEMAAEYIDAYVKGRLIRAKRRVMMEGRWSGGVIPTGYMIDMRKELPDGTKNEQWRRYVPFEPHATVVREYFRLFLEHAGNIRQTQADIQEHGPYFPNPDSCPPPEGFKIQGSRMFRMKQNVCPGRVGLQQLLLNAAYIGHWLIGGSITRWNNHEAIVPLDLFMRAFNYSSPVTLDGRPNPDYHPLVQNARPSLDQDRPEERPLCSGMITTIVDGKRHKVGTNWNKTVKSYSYMVWDHRRQGEYVRSKTARLVDEKVITLLRGKLRSTFRESDWDKVLAEFTLPYQEERQRLLHQLTALKQVMHNQVTSLELITNPSFIAEAEARYGQAQTEYARLSAELARATNEIAQVEAVQILKHTCSPALEGWDELKRDEKVSLLHLLILGIEAKQTESRGTELSIKWRDGTSDIVTIPHQTWTGTECWSPSDAQTLFALIDAHTSPLDIAAAFPTRTWKQITNKVYCERGKGVFRRGESPIWLKETYEMYLERKTRQERDHRPATCHDRWTTSETERLVELVHAGATNIELAETFPYRTWQSIRVKIKDLCGKYFAIPMPDGIKPQETIADYHRRVRPNEAYCEQCPVTMDSDTELYSNCQRSQSQPTTRAIRSRRHWSRSRHTPATCSTNGCPAHNRHC
ncbi:MAG: recombinase family protein [Aggregatilineales bacterium]